MGQAGRSGQRCGPLTSGLCVKDSAQASHSQMAADAEESPPNVTAGGSAEVRRRRVLRADGLGPDACRCRRQHPCPSRWAGIIRTQESSATSLANVNCIMRACNRKPRDQVRTGNYYSSMRIDSFFVSVKQTGWEIYFCYTFCLRTNRSAFSL